MWAARGCSPFLLDEMKLVSVTLFFYTAHFFLYIIKKFSEGTCTVSRNFLIIGQRIRQSRVGGAFTVTGGLLLTYPVP
jgi:hypothetical protein